MDTPSTVERVRSALADRYRLDRELGQGGMATVFLAQDVRHQRKVAIKVLHPELSAVLGPERFLKEIELTASLQHPHILPLFDSGAAFGLLYYVMPYVEGETLRARLSREHQLPLADALRIASEVADALEYAHKRGVVHRDIKPENILLHEGRPQVADFGIALAVQQAGGSRMTQTGMSLGTPQYMAPEQAMGERTIDHRADLYALGAVSYEMLTGEPPFSGPTSQAIVAKIMSDQPRPPSELRRAVPPAVEAAVLTALEKLPADRWSSAAEFAAALNAPEPHRLRPTAASRRAIPAGRDRTRWLFAALATTTLLALAWGARATLRSPPLSPAPVVRFTIPGALGRAFSGNMIAISRDGTKLVFVQDNPSLVRTRLMLRRLDGLETLPIPGTDGALAPFFSPDGEWIAFSDGSRVRKTRVAGGGVTSVAALVGSTVSRGSWGPNDILVLTDRRGRLYRVPASGGTPEPIAPGDSAVYRDPSWLPDGEHLLVSRSRNASDPGLEILVVSARDGRMVAQLGPGNSPQYVAAGYLTWLSPEGSLLAAPFDLKAHRLRGSPVSLAEGFSFLARTSPLAVAGNGTLAYSASGWSDKELVLVSPGAEPRVLPLGTRAFRGPRFSPDGSRIVVDVEPGGDLVGDIWLFDIAPQTFTRLSFEGSGVFPEWSPDGRDVLYSAETPNGRGILRVPADRSASPEVLTTSRATNIFEGQVTPDGKQLLYRENSDSTGRDILLLVGKTVSRWAGGPFNERAAALTRDGQLAAYVSDESGRDEIYLKPLAGGGAVLLSSQGGIEPRWGPGDRELFFRLRDSLFAVPITRQPALRVGARRLAMVAAYVSEPYHANYDVAPDGRTFVFVRQTGGSSFADVTVVLNRFAGPLARSP